MEYLKELVNMLARKKSIHIKNSKRNAILSLTAEQAVMNDLEGWKQRSVVQFIVLPERGDIQIKLASSGQKKGV